MITTLSHSESPRMGRRTLLWAGAAFVAAQAVGSFHDSALAATRPELPAATRKRPKGVTFITTGATFSPELELQASSTATVRWLDPEGNELARGTHPTIEFGQVATRTVIMVTTFSHVRSLNLGFDASWDAGDYGPGEAYNKVPEAISRVWGLWRLNELRQFLASGTQLGGRLNVSGLTHLRYIECFCAHLTSVDLTGCKRLVRLCLEANSLTKLDLNPVAKSLRDLRAAAQSTGRLKFAKLKRPLSRLYHLCVRDQLVTGHPSSSKLPACRELWNWNTGQKGAMPRAGAAESVVSYGNAYTSVDMTGEWRKEGYGTLDLTDNKLVSVKLKGCRGLNNILLSGNKLSQSQVDRILAEVASWNTSGMSLALEGQNAAPSAAGLASIEILRNLGWNVSHTTEYE